MTGPWDVVVVGAGQAGLAMGYHLRRLGARFVLLDSGSAVGQVWRSRWDSLRLFTPAQYANLPGLPFPAPADTYPGKDAVADYLADYAAHFDLPVRLDSPVTALTLARNGFALSTPDGAVHARRVVVAAGPFHTPHIPATSEDFASEVVQLHSSRYRNPSQLPGRHVVVVGGGNSGFQIAAELAATHRVTLASGTANATVPQRLLGRDLFWWQTATGLITAPADSHRGRWMRRGEGTVIGHTRRGLRRAGITFRPRLTHGDGHTARFADGTHDTVDALVWATGYRRDHTWIAIDGAIDHQGVLRHHRGITPIPGLYVLGLPWLHTTGSALLGFVRHDAAHLANHIAAADNPRPAEDNADSTGSQQR